MVWPHSWKVTGTATCRLSDQGRVQGPERYPTSARALRNAGGAARQQSASTKQSQEATSSCKPRQSKSHIYIAYTVYRVPIRKGATHAHAMHARKAMNRGGPLQVCLHCTTFFNSRATCLQPSRDPSRDPLPSRPQLLYHHTYSTFFEL